MAVASPLLRAAAGGASLLLRQLFDADTGTFTYLLADGASGEGVLIDPVFEQHNRDLALAFQGLLVGLLTGIAGVGGGFAIVPALVLLAGLPMPLASGTSLLLIAVNSLVAMAALGHWPAASLPLVLPLVGGGVVGALGGQRLAPHLPDRQLRRGFAALLVGSALLSGMEAWRRQAPSATQTTHRPSIGSLGTTTGAPRTSPALAGNAPTGHHGDAGSAAPHLSEPATPTPSTV